MKLPQLIINEKEEQTTLASSRGRIAEEIARSEWEDDTKDNPFLGGFELKSDNGEDVCCTAGMIAIPNPAFAGQGIYDEIKVAYTIQCGLCNQYLICPMEGWDMEDVNGSALKLRHFENQIELEGWKYFAMDYVLCPECRKGRGLDEKI